MGKKPAAKTTPAPVSAKEDLTTQVFCIQQHQPQLYEAIVARGCEEAYSMVKEANLKITGKGEDSIIEGRIQEWTEGKGKNTGE
jgi:hypothetical protein